MAVTKVKIVMDLTKDEADRLDTTIKALRTSKVGFLRKSLDEDSLSILYYSGLAKQCVNGYSGLADAKLVLIDNTYTCEVDTEKWIVTIFRHDEHSAIGLPIHGFFIG